MLRNSMLFVSFGVVWLFLFSIPMGGRKSLFDVAHYYIVDTRPVHWVMDKVKTGIDATDETAQDASEMGQDFMKNRLSRTDRLDAIE